MANRFLSNIRINEAYTFPETDGNSGQAIVTDGAGNLAFADVAAGADAASVIYRDSFTGDGTTTQFVMEKNVTSEDQTQIYIDGVYQEKDTYSVVGNVINFLAAPGLNHSIEVMTISGISVGPTVIRQDNFTGNGTATDFTLTNTVSDEVKTMVFFNGVYQFKGTYSVAGTLISFDTAPATGVDIEVITIESASGDRESQRILFYGKASGAISKGDAVMFAGAEGDHFLFSKATQAAIEAQSELFIGLANQDFVNNEFGFVVEFGRIDSIDTTVYTSTAGTILWFDSAGTVAGAITETEPVAPNAKIQVAAVIRLHPAEGSLFVRPSWYHELNDLEDVNITSIADKDMLVWDNANQYWENSKILGDITTGNITTSGTVDGVDLSAFKSDYDTRSVNWDTAYGWGDHALAGYLTTFTETDPTVPAHVKAITTAKISNWDTAFSWGNHASAGYITGYTETDTLATVTGRGNSTTSIINGVDIRSQGQIRATGWYNTNSGTHTGLGTEIGISGGQSYILSYNRDSSSYGSLTIAATQVNTDNSFRAPIFYDSNNTAYYLDPASTSVTNEILVGAGNVRLRRSTGSFGSLEADGGAVGGYEGFSIGGRAVFMHDNGSVTGIYNDVNNQWLLYGNHNAQLRLFFAGAQKAETSSAGFTVNGTLTETSARRYKKNIVDLESSLSMISRIRPVRFDWIEDDSHSIGFIAEEVDEVLPELVLYNSESYEIEGVSYTKMVPVLTKAIQELIGINKEQQKEIDELKKIIKG